MERYLVAFLKGTAFATMGGIVVGFLVFSVVGFFQGGAPLYTGYIGSWIFGALGLLGGGAASCINLARATN